MSIESEAELAHSLDLRAIAADEAGDTESAGLYFSEALSIRRTIAAQDPAYRGLLAMSLRNMGVFWRRRNDRAQALDLIAESAEIYSELAEAEPEKYRAEHGKSLAMAAHIHAEQGEAGRAEAAFRDCVAAYRQLSKAFPVPHVIPFGNALRAYGELLAGQGRELEAARMREAALGVYRLDPADSDARARAIGMLDAQASAFAGAGRAAQAAEKMREFLVEVAALEPAEAARWAERARAVEEELRRIGG